MALRGKEVRVTQSVVLSGGVLIEGGSLFLEETGRVSIEGNGGALVNVETNSFGEPSIVVNSGAVFSIQNCSFRTTPRGGQLALPRISVTGSLDVQDCAFYGWSFCV